MSVLSPRAPTLPEKAHPELAPLPAKKKTHPELALNPKPLETPKA